MSQTSRLRPTELLFTSNGTNTNVKLVATSNTFTLNGTTNTTGEATITGVKDPVNPSDVATKNYVDTTPTAAGGNNTEIQYNNSGDFGGITGFTTNGTNSITISDNTTLNVGSGVGNLAISYDGTTTSFATVGAQESTILFELSNFSASSFNVRNTAYNSYFKLDSTEFSISSDNNIWRYNTNELSTSGDMNLQSFNGITTEAGGVITINGGDGGATSGVGGNVIIQAGTAASATDAGNTIIRIASTGSSGTPSTTNCILFQSSNGLSNLARIEQTGAAYALSFNATSDARLKENIKPLTNSLDIISKIEGYSYDINNNTNQYGVLAQQLESIGLSNLVSGPDDSKAVNYLGLIPLLIEAIKELKNKI